MKESKLMIYNTAEKRLEEFIPIKPKEVGIYVCGPTVYDDCHLGHARALVAFDIVYRWLTYHGFRVRYVRNITDIDDKIIKRAAEKGISCEDLASHYIREFHKDMDKLSMVKPTEEPRATEHISEMVELVSLLLEKGLAYEVDGDVFYDVSGFKDYGKLSGKKPDELLSGARVEVDERKRSPLDFALWKSAKEGEPYWPSPWGNGRPGWHVECSVMSARYLGETFDIHAGGQDLIFPHHENEIAQSEGATGRPLARYWMHNAHVTVDEKKMSKSLGNFFTLKQIYEKFEPRTVRFLLLSRHYRTPIDFSDRSLYEAGASLGRIEECVGRLEEVLKKDIGPADKCPMEFVSAMDEDFNTTKAVGFIFSLVGQINVEIDRCGDGWMERASRFAAGLKKCCEVLGVELVTSSIIRVGEARDEFDDRELEDYLERETLSRSDIEILLQMRNALRKRGDFKRADQVRLRLKELGYELRDVKRGGATVRIDKAG